MLPARSTRPDRSTWRRTPRPPNPDHDPSAGPGDGTVLEIISTTPSPGPPRTVRLAPQFVLGESSPPHDPATERWVGLSHRRTELYAAELAQRHTAESGPLPPSPLRHAGLRRFGFGGSPRQTDPCGRTAVRRRSQGPLGGSCHGGRCDLDAHDGADPDHGFWAHSLIDFSRTPERQVRTFPRAPGSRSSRLAAVGCVAWWLVGRPRRS